ncbi:MAG: GH116 family glycosyl hydrolase [Armatimonadota bacterium]
MKYLFRNSENIADSGIPLGGIGTGAVELRPDGRFYEWNIFNNKPFSWNGPEKSGMDVSDAYFAVRVKSENSTPKIRLLSTAPNCREMDVYTAPYLRNIQAIEFDGKYPFVEAQYYDDNLPIDIQMEAFSPFIPNDLHNSSLPSVCFGFMVTNRSDEKISASLLFFVRNQSLYGAEKRKLRIKKEEYDELKMLLMDADGDRTDPTFGSMCIGTDAEVCDTFLGYRYDVKWEDEYEVNITNYWKHFRETGNLPESKDSGQAGVISTNIELEPGETKTVNFYLGWHFPNLIGKKPQSDYIGHYYNTFLKDAKDAVVYMYENLYYLYNESKKFSKLLYKKNNAQWLADTLSGQLATLSKSAWHGEKGQFAVWEGLGCCGLQTIDVGYYGSIPIALIFPEVEKRQMILSSKFPKPDGRVPHLFEGTFESVDETGYIRIDMIPQYTLMLYRDWLWLNDKSYLSEVWEFTKKSMEYIHKTDKNGDGLPDNKGVDQTYDVWKFFGTSAYVSCLYLASLKAGAELAKVMDEPKLAEKYEARYSKGVESFVSQLWNGEYFILWNEISNNTKDEGVMAGALDGQWYAHMLGLGYILPEEMVKSHLGSVMKYNFDHEHGLLNGAYPEGVPIPEQVYKSHQILSPWSGTEYAVASHMIYEGMYDEAISVIYAVEERYYERCRYWDHKECGGHYYRAMVAWAILMSMNGQKYNKITNTLHLSPAFIEGKSPLILPGFVGEIIKTKSSLCIRHISGSLELDNIVCTGLGKKPKSISYGSKKQDFSVSKEDNAVNVSLKKTISIKSKKLCIE